MKHIQIIHSPTQTLLAEGPVGWSLMPFEGNYYIHRKHLRTSAFKVNWIPGLCIYKFLYVWMDLRLKSGERVHNLAWMYWLPNPLLPFIWFRVAIPADHPEIEIQENDRSGLKSAKMIRGRRKDSRTESAPTREPEGQNS